MKKSKLFRTLTLAVAAALCMATTTVTAYAGGADPDPVPLPETTEAPAEVPEETEEPTTGGMEPEGVPVTPQGNAALVDDFFGDKQLITVTTKAGNYFYILIDRANEDKETAVHFLNQVDDADLQALLEHGKKEPEGLHLYGQMSSRGRQYGLPGLQKQPDRLQRAGAEAPAGGRKAAGGKAKRHGRPCGVLCGGAAGRRRGPLLPEIQKGKSRHHRQ